MDPALVELIHASSDGSEVEVLARLRRPEQLPPGLRRVTQFGEVVTGRVLREQLRPVWAHENVLSLKAPRAYYWNDTDELESSSDIEPWPGDGQCRQSALASGRGVVVGVCDWGLDVGHDDFRHADGSTRVLALWDQSSTEGEAPEPFRYGRVMHRAEIDAALRSSTPYDTLGYRAAPVPGGTHGTHVTGIAAGNGRAPGSIRSAAHEADIVFVHLHAGGTPGLGNLGDSVRLLEAIDFIRQTAGARPWVCNCSLGRTGGPHDGTTLVEKGLDALVQEPGRAIVMSAGNYYSHGSASSGMLRAGRTSVLGWRVFEADRTQNELELWYSAEDDLVVRLRAPDGRVVATASLGDRTPILLGGREAGRLYHRACDPNNGDHQIDIFLDPGSPGGDWRVELEPISVRNGHYYAWIERDPGPPGTQSRFTPDGVSRECTTGTICNGHFSIAVGAIDAHDPDQSLGNFSSGGRLRDGRMKPDLVAPGVQVLSAQSAGSEGDPVSAQTRKSGTSMATPHVTAAVAAMMQVAPRPLGIAETRRILFESATKLVRPADTARLGAGLLNLERAIELARGATLPLVTAPAVPAPRLAARPTPPARRVTESVPESLPEPVGSSDWRFAATVWLPLSASVGPGAQNHASDLALVQQRLIEFGLLRPHDAQRDRDALARGHGRSAFTDEATAAFQAALRLAPESVVVPGSTTHRLLMRPALPVARALNLAGPVGEGAPRSEADERRVRARLLELGFAETTTPLTQAIVRFQEHLLSEATGRLLPGSLDERVLSDPTFGTLSTFPRLTDIDQAAGERSRAGGRAHVPLQQATVGPRRSESLSALAEHAGVPTTFGPPGLTGPTALGALARHHARVQTTLSRLEVERLARRAACIGALFDELFLVHLPSDARTPLREVARSLLFAFDSSLQQETGLFPADLLRMLRAQRAASSGQAPGMDELRTDELRLDRLRIERSAFQTKGLLTSPEGQALREVMSGSLSDVLTAGRSTPPALESVPGT